MHRRRVWTPAAAVLVGALAAQHAAPPTWAKSGRQRLDVKVAIQAGDRCGDFADAAPVLVTVVDALPGTASPAVKLCLKNSGTIAGRLTMSTTQRLERELDCSEGEADVDATCGSGLTGDLGPHIAHFIARDRNCIGSTKQPTVADFAVLEATPLVLHDMVGPEQVFCVLVWTRYEPATEAGELAAQSDEVTWVYSFRLDTP